MIALFALAAIVAVGSATTATIGCTQAFTTNIQDVECIAFNAGIVVANANLASSGFSGFTLTGSCSGNTYYFGLTGTISNGDSCSSAPANICSGFSDGVSGFNSLFAETPSGEIVQTCTTSSSSCFPAHATVQLQVCMILIVLVVRLC